MRAYYFVFLFMRLWLAVAFVLGLWALSEFIYSRKHSFKMLGRRILTILFWPVAIASANGRKSIMGNLGVLQK